MNYIHEHYLSYSGTSAEETNYLKEGHPLKDTFYYKFQMLTVLYSTIIHCTF